MRPTPSRQKIALTPTAAAPMGGLNGRDSLAAMPPQDASVFTNLFAETTRIRTRAGHATLSTASSIGMVNQYEGFNTLISYKDTTLFAVFGYFENTGAATGRGRIYSVNTTTGALTLSAELTAGVESLQYLGEWTQFTAASGTTYIIWPIVTDLAGRIKGFDGATWANQTITGLAGTMSGAHSHKNRVWLYNINTATAYYLPTGAVSGAVTAFSLGQVATKGGGIISMQTWTMDGGDGGTDDVAVFITTNGQVIIYSGSDPSSRNTWQLVGVFNIAKPAAQPTDLSSIDISISGQAKNSVGVKYGADVLMLMQDGVTSAQRVLHPQDLGSADYSISSKIRPLIAEQIRTQASLYTKLLPFEKLNQLFVNIVTAVTTSGGGAAVINKTYTSVQYVMNTETGAWHKFDSMNMKDAIVHAGSLYFTDGAYTLKKYDGTATSDAGSAITFECRQAYSYFDYPDNKLATLLQPMMRWTGNFSLTVQADADFNPGTISSYTSYTVSAEANVNPFISPAKYGAAFAVHMKGQTSAGVGSWYATNWAMQPGGIF